jgi:NhaA family Na+:H+ antiporter
LAIIDDIVAILVIAVFYSSGFQWVGVALAGGGVVAVIAFQRLGLRRPAHYVPAGRVVWIGLHWAGVHPTMAGVLLGLLTPVRAWFGEQGLLDEAGAALREIEATLPRRTEGAALMSSLDRIDLARREAVSPVTFLENALHPWVAYAIMPLFALASAGVTLGSVDRTITGAATIVAGVALGLVVGKPLGIVLASFLAVKLGPALPPREGGWSGVLVVGCAGGIGFTMALFIAQLAFRDASQLALAKLAILIASALAGLGALLAGVWLLPADRDQGTATGLDA